MALDLGVIDNIDVCALKQGGAALVSLTLTSANTNAAFANNIPAGTKYIEFYCASTCQIALGEATSSTVGRFITGGLPTVMRVKASDVAAGKKINAQSATAGAVLYASYLPG